MGCGAWEAARPPRRPRLAVLLAAAHCIGIVDASRSPTKPALLEVEARSRRRENATDAVKVSNNAKALPFMSFEAPAVSTEPGHGSAPTAGWVVQPEDILGREARQGTPPAYEPMQNLPKVDHSLLRGFGKWFSPYTWELLLNVGSGTGAAPGSTGDLVLDQDLMQRMRFQDKVVMILLLVAYAGSLAFSANLAYRQSLNDSPITYYADPRFHTQVCESHDLEDFLDAFNTPPKDVQLQITGFAPLPPLHESFVDAAVDWLGSHYRIAFSFALDLSPWVVHDEVQQDRQGEGSGSEVGISSEDLERLRDFLDQDTNDLAAVQVEKEVHWSDWEELATNIKHQIRQNGFQGVIHVCCAEDEVVTVYKNKAWANFMHRRTTKVLCALSIVGWLVYQPYMWFRHRAVVVTSRYRVDVDIGSYWPLIADKVGPEGFNSS